jgi:hypothetical protein
MDKEFNLFLCLHFYPKYLEDMGRNKSFVFFANFSLLFLPAAEAGACTIKLFTAVIVAVS